MLSALISQELFVNMNFDVQNDNLKTTTESTDCFRGDCKPSVLIVFSNSDVNAAIYYLNKSLNSPFDPRAIATVLVQEAIKEDFIEKLKQQIKPFSSGKIKSSEKFSKALETAKKLNASLIMLNNHPEDDYKPALVCDFTHEQLTTSPPSGIVTLHTFRTVKEAISLVNKESLKFANVSIWHENHGHAYEFVTALKSNFFFINCYQVPLNILEENINKGKNYVCLDKSYHYESLQHDGIQKTVVFPIGSIFAN